MKPRPAISRGRRSRAVGAPMRPLHDFGELIFTEIMKLCIAPIEGVFNADGPSAVRVPSWPVLRRKRDRRAKGVPAAWRQAKAFARRSRAGDRVPMESAESDVVSKLPATRVSRDRSSARPADLCGPPRAASGSMSALPRRESVSADGAALRCAVPMSGLSPPVCGNAVARHATPRGQAGSADRDDARLLQPLISQAASASHRTTSKSCPGGANRGTGQFQIVFPGCRGSRD